MFLMRARAVPYMAFANFGGPSAILDRAMALSSRGKRTHAGCFEAQSSPFGPLTDTSVLRRDHRGHPGGDFDRQFA
jgi:hypothetical protein